MGGCVLTLPRLRQTLTVTSTTAVFFPGTAWRPVTGTTDLDISQNLLSLDGPGECKPGAQLAIARTDKPGAGFAITAGAYTGTVGFQQYREAASGASSAFIRFGTMARLAAGQTGQAVLVVESDISLNVCGAVLGAKQVEVHPYMNGTVDADTPIVVLTDWVPTLKIDKLKGIAVVMDNQNTSFEYAFLVRSCVDRSAPGAWVLLEAAYTNPAAGNTERNTGELTPPAGANFATKSWFQVGVGVRKKSGSTGNPRCVLHAMVHCKLA